MGDLSEHFSTWEFRCRHCGQVLLNQDLVPTLERIRARYGRPMMVVSGYRCPEHNAKIGGGPEHLDGQAADIAITNSQERFELIKAAIEEGIKRIGPDEGFVHIGISKTLPQRVIWLYPRKAETP